MSSHHDQQHNPSAGHAAPPKRKGKMKFIIIPLVAVLIAIAAFVMWPSNISRQEAQNIALAHVGGGNANRADFDFEGFQRVWSVEVFHGGLVHEVFVNRSTGNIVRVEIDSWD